MVSPEQAAVIVDAVDALPLDETLRAKAEGILLEEAARLDATALAVVGKKIAAVVDPDGEERRQQQKLDREERAAHHRRFLSITDDGAGGAWLKGRGTAEDAAILKAALLPLTKPTPAVDPHDPDEETLTDPRDHGARLWDALVATCQHALATDLPPQCHGARPRLAVTTDLDSLRSGLGERIDWTRLGEADPTSTDPTSTVLAGYRCPGGTTEDGTHLSPAAVRRLACDADVIPVALGTRGQVLDVGRTNRLVTAGDLDRPGLPRPALRVPRLHQTAGDVPRPPHHPLGRRRHHRPRQPGPALWPPPPGHPPHPLGSPDQPERRPTRIPTTTQTRRPAGLDQKQTPTRMTAVSASVRTPAAPDVARTAIGT